MDHNISLSLVSLLSISYSKTQLFSCWPILGKDGGVWQKIDNRHSPKSIPTVVTRWQNSYKHFKPNLEMRCHPSCAPTNHSVKVAGNSAQTQIDLTRWRWDQSWWNVIQFNGVARPLGSTWVQLKVQWYADRTQDVTYIFVFLIAWFFVFLIFFSFVFLHIFFIWVFCIFVGGYFCIQLGTIWRLTGMQCSRQTGPKIATWDVTVWDIKQAGS